jgi:hypothetical protein
MLNAPCSCHCPLIGVPQSPRRLHRYSARAPC